MSDESKNGMIEECAPANGKKRPTPDAESAKAANGDANAEKPAAPRKKKSGMDMLHGPLRGKIVLFAIPLALSSILQQLFNSADAIVAGQFLGSTELAAIGGIAPLITLFIGMFVGLSIGTNASIATRIGHGERDRIHDAVQTTAVVALACAVVVMLAGVFATELIVDSVGMPGEARAEAVSYLRIYLIGIAFFLVYNFGSAILRAKGDTRRPLYALAVAVVLNCALDVAAVAVLGMGAAGIAAATVVSYAVAAAIIVAMLMREEEAFRLDVRHLRAERSSRSSTSACRRACRASCSRFRTSSSRRRSTVSAPMRSRDPPRRSTSSTTPTLS